MSTLARSASLPAGYLPDSPGAELCRRFCSRLCQAGAGDPILHRPVSHDGLALCAHFCRGFAARRPAIVVSRGRRRSTAPSETLQ